MSTSGARPLHGGLTQPSSCVAGRVAAHAEAAPGRPAAALDRGWRSSSDHSSKPYPTIFVFLQNAPKI